MYINTFIYLFIYFIYLLEPVKEKVQLQEKHHFVTIVGKFLWLKTIKRTEWSSKLQRKKHEAICEEKVIWARK